MASTIEHHPGPLSGVRVLDLSRLLPGPYASQILRDLGAEVIKVEDTDGGDYCRYYPPLMPDSNSSVFHALNRGKKSVVINLKKEAGKQQLSALIATAHIVIETFRPGVLAKLGFAPEKLLQQHPHLIVCSISGYGQTGPEALRAGHDLNYLARGGVLGMMKDPKVLPVQVGDIAGGSWPAATQILAALRQSEKTGKGAIIDVSMTDAGYAMMVMALAKYSASGAPVGQGRDVLSGQFPCYDVYKTKDGHITVGNLEPKFWTAMCKSMNLPDILDGAFAEGADGEQIRSTLQKKLMTQTNAQWAEQLKNVDTCVEPVYQPENRAEEDPQLRTRDLDIEVTVGDQRIKLVKTPLRMTGIEHAAAPGPKIGEHTKQILGTLKAKL